MSYFRTTELSDPAFECEGLRFITVQSPALGRRGDLALFFPDGWQDMHDLPLLTLLHGVYGSHWVWPFKGGAHRTAREMIGAGEIQPIAIAMPSDGLWGEGSGYLPHEDADYERWIVEDVPTAVMENVPVVTPASKRYIGGLSMGGYGALRLGARYADVFAGISAHSSITDASQLTKFIAEDMGTYRLRETEGLDTFDWITKNAEHLPPLRFDCGTDDLLIEENRDLHRRLEQAGIPHHYEEFPGGHEWPYWTLHLRDSLRFFDQLPIKGGVQTVHPKERLYEN